MSVGLAIHARLAAHAGTLALVVARIYPLRLPQGVTLPAVRYQVISAPREHAMGADTGTVHALVQVDCFATTYAGAKALADEVRDALSRWDGTAGTVVVQHIFLVTELDRFESDPLNAGEKGITRVMLTFRVHYTE